MMSTTMLTLRQLRRASQSSFVAPFYRLPSASFPVAKRRLHHNHQQHCCLSSAATPAPISSHLPSLDLASCTQIQGEESHVAIVTLAPGQSLRATTGSMLYMTQGVSMETSSDVSSGMKRFLTGQNVFVTDFTNTGNADAEVALGTAFPSKILRLHLPDYPSQSLICQKGAYLASDKAIDMDMAFTKSFTSGFFGGEGFVLQKLQGEGDVLIQAGGTVVRRELEENETLRVSSGCLVAMTSDVDYDVQMMPGFKNVMFGGEGLFVTTLKGPGTVWLQGMPPDRMISEIARRIPSGMGLGIPIGVGGGGSASGEAEEGAGEEGGEAQDMVAATDAAVEGDRQATVASSGFSEPQTDEAVDADSPSALFGDAAGSEKDVPPPMQEETSDDSWMQEETSTFSSNEPKFEDDFGEESFSTEDNFSDGFDEGFQDDSTFSDLDDSAMSDAAESAQETSSSIFSTLWDIFSGDE